MTTSITGILNNGLKRADSLPKDNRVSLTAFKGESIGIELSLYNMDGTAFRVAGAYTIVLYISTRLGERIMRHEYTGATAGQDQNVTNFVIQLPRYIIPQGYMYELYVSYGVVVESQIMPTSSLLVTQTAR